MQGAILGILIDATPQLIQVGTGQAHFNLSGMAVSGVLGAIFLGALKIWLSQSDPQVGMLLDAYAKQKQAWAFGQIFVAGSDGTTQIPAMHFVLPAPAVIVTTSTVPVKSDGTVATSTAKPDPSGIQAVFPVTLKDPHDAPTDPHPVVDSSLLNTQQVPAVTMNAPATQATTTTQFVPMAFTVPPPVPALSANPLVGGIPLPPQQ